MLRNATLALVGRPNVGKSTLFNRLTRRRDALVADVPGLTRDRRYGRAQLADRMLTLIDTGGLMGDAGALTGALEAQAGMALEESDLILFLVDARDGLTVDDQEIAARLRRLDKPVVLVVNKIDAVSEAAAEAEFSQAGFPAMVTIAASHGRGLDDLEDAVREGLAYLEVDVSGDDSDESATSAGEDPDSDGEGDRIRVAIIGRPNVGKSTLINRLLGEQRQLVFDAPGTTRDAISIPFEKEGRRYLLIDTAGVRRKGRTEGVAEKFSVVKSLQAIEEAHVVIMVMDATEGVVDQDLHLIGYAVESGSGVLVAVNKWDGLSGSDRDAVNRSIDRKLNFAPWIPVMRISALHGTGVGHLLDEVHAIYRAGVFDVSTTLLTRLLEGMVEAHSPPTVRGRPVKLRFAHKAGEHPPRIMIHGKQTNSIPASYVRYLENGYREALKLTGNPVHIELKTGDNPFAGKRNPLTRRQQQRRKRVITHHRKGR